MRRMLRFSFQLFTIKKLVVLLVSFYMISSVTAQQTTTFIKAASKKIKVLDGDYLQDGELVPDLNPDTYYFHPSVTPKRIAYYTDKDSIVFWAKAGDTFNFAIVLNGKDTCYQRVTSENPNKVHYSSSKKGLVNDTISFVLGPNNAIHLKGKINNSKVLDLIFDTGASIGVLSEEGKRKQASLRSDNKNIFEIGNVVISNSPITYINYHGDLRADGVIGYNSFEGKVVEVNYDQSIIVVHHGTFNNNDYASIEMKWGGSAMFVEGEIQVKNKKHKGLFLFDTGSKWAISLNKGFAVENNLYETTEKIGTRRSKGVDGKTIKSNTVKLPAFHLGGHLVPDVPTDIELPERSEGILAFNILGNDVLKRFNIMLDYKNGLIYLKPNGLQNASYNKSLDEKDILFIAVIFACIVFIVFLFYRNIKRQSVP